MHGLYIIYKVTAKKKNYQRDPSRAFHVAGRVRNQHPLYKQIDRKILSSITHLDDWKLAMWSHHFAWMKALRISDFFLSGIFVKILTENNFEIKTTLIFIWCVKRTREN